MLCIDLLRPYFSYISLEDAYHTVTDYWYQSLRHPMTQHPCFQLQLYISSAGIEHHFSCDGTSSSSAFATYFMYLYHFISIDLKSSRSCNSTTLQAYSFPSLSFA